MKPKMLDDVDKLGAVMTGMDIAPGDQQCWSLTGRAYVDKEMHCLQTNDRIETRETLVEHIPTACDFRSLSLMPGKPTSQNPQHCKAAKGDRLYA